MPRRLLLCFLFLPLAISAQQTYDGPPPPKKDIPYLVHASNLVETDRATAQQQDKKNETIFTISGDAAKARTPLASPILIIDSDKISPERLQLFRLQSKNGHREVSLPKKGRTDNGPLNLSVTRLKGNLYRLEVVDSLENGEYALTPEGSNDVFCFAVF